MYGNVTPNKVKRILDEQDASGNQPIVRMDRQRAPQHEAKTRSLPSESEIVLRNCGIIDPKFH